MIKIKIIAIGKIKEPFYKAAIAEYQKRLKKYCDLSILNINDEIIYKDMSEIEIKKLKNKEGEKIINNLKDSDYVIALDLVNAIQYESLEFAHHIDSLNSKGKGSIVFVIGGALGLGDNIREKASERLNLSKMTFTHPMTQIILLEQLYRVFKILNNEAYHK